MDQPTHIFIGSSPLFLMCHNALNKVRPGQSLLIEGSSRIGGAWYTGDVWDAKNSELGCHILKNIPEGYALMKQQGVALREMKQQPALLVTRITGESKLNTFKNALLYLGAKLASDKTYSKYAIAKLSNLIKKQPLAKYHYLEQGCHELLKNLAPDLPTVRMEQMVEELNVKEDHAVITLKDGSVYRADKVHLPKNYKIERLIIHGETIPVGYNTYISEHYLLKYPKHTTRFSFVECIGDDLLNLVSKVSLYTESAFDIIAVAVKKPSGRQENNLSVSDFSGLPTLTEQQEIASRLHQKFMSFGLVPKNTAQPDFHYEPYILNTKDKKDTALLAEKSGGILVFPETTDLVESVLKNPVLNGA